ncbi:HNH endonuclease [Massilia norwichensis]|uniref:HNH endonuclease n=1 Tax=Massilia norwichensis TaxID=1442366 RepID=A0ABT2A799_9BURK|nr:HNH endonuclease [Massilia norwichensis]MCS0589992.1 HNH endonuclease [Massilia norwichensis]
MKQCIICRKFKEAFSDEHVIPDALGGYYHIYSVCTQCNSRMGSTVDVKLVNHKFSEFQRFTLGLKGKSKKLPNPFIGIHRIDGEESRRVQLRIDGDGKLVPYVVPTVEYEKLDDGTRVSICVDASDKNKLSGILDGVAKKLKVPLEQLKLPEQAVRSIARPNIQGGFSIDLFEFKIGLLKIAYEFAVDTIPEYFHDDAAVEIAEILFHADHSRVEKYVNIGSGFERNLFSSLEKYLDIAKKKHFLVLCSHRAGGLSCLMHLHQLFAVGVSLSKKMYPDHLFVVGVNDIEKKSFRKIFGEELSREVYGVPFLRFQYYFENEAALMRFQELQMSEHFEVIQVKGEIPVFDKSGNALETTLNEKMNAVAPLAKSEFLSEKEFICTYNFAEDVFVKVNPGGELVQVTAVREEYVNVSKI